MGFIRAQRDHAQVVTQEQQHVMVAVERGELREQLALVRVLDVGFQRQQALGLGQPEELVHHAQQFDVVVLVVTRLGYGACCSVSSIVLGS